MLYNDTSDCNLAVQMYGIHKFILIGMSGIQRYR